MVTLRLIVMLLVVDSYFRKVVLSPPAQLGPEFLLRAVPHL